MFKKSLLALALTGAAITANAATITAGGTTAVALEGNQTTALGNNTLVAADAGAVTTTIGTAYIVNDVVQFTVSGAEFDTTAAAPTLVGGAATYTFIDFADANTARFRVTVADAVSGNAIVFGGWTLKTNNATASTKVTMTSAALSSNASIGAYDKPAAAAAVFDFQNQLTTTITGLNGEVSTGAGRAQFTATAPADKQDVLTLANTDNAGVDALTINKAVHVVKGDFSWFNDYDAVVGDKDGVLEAGEITSAVTFTGCTSAVATLNATLTELTVTDSGALAASCAIELNNIGNAAGGSAIVAPQSFTVSSTYSDAANNKIVVAEKSAGAFTLDGTSEDIAFLPYGPDYFQSITVSNDGSVEGAITVTLTHEGMSYTKTLTAVASAKTVTNISTEVREFATASGITSGDVAINVTVNAPGIVVKGVYYHAPSQDRVLTK